MNAVVKRAVFLLVHRLVQALLIVEKVQEDVEWPEEEKEQNAEDEEDFVPLCILLQRDEEFSKENGDEAEVAGDDVLKRRTVDQVRSQIFFKSLALLYASTQHLDNAKQNEADDCGNQDDVEDAHIGEYTLAYHACRLEELVIGLIICNLKL